MTRIPDKQYVARHCQMMGYSLLKPSKQAPEILVMDWRSGFGKVIVEALTWKQAREGLAAHERGAAL